MTDTTPIPLAELERVVVPLVAVARDATWHPVGTAFVIAVASPNSAVCPRRGHRMAWTGVLKRVE